MASEKASIVSLSGDVRLMLKEAVVLADGWTWRWLDLWRGTEDWIATTSV